MVQVSPSRDLDKFMLRLPDGMRGAIQQAAAKSRRSMNSEIVFQLERTYRSPEAAGQVSQAEVPAASSNPTALPGGEIINQG